MAKKNTSLGPDDVQWIVNDIGELGVLVQGRAFFLYKGESLEYRDPKHDEGEGERLYRLVYKREFGEVCRPRDYWDADGYSRYPGLYDLGPEEHWHPLRELLEAES